MKMSSAQDAGGREHTALKKLAGTARAVLNAAAGVPVLYNGRPFYALPDLLLLELAAATREAEAVAKADDEA